MCSFDTQPGAAGGRINGSMLRHYRFYRLNHRNQIVEADDGYCADDDEAWALAREHAAVRACAGVEIWNRDRLVGRVEALRSAS